MIDRTNEWKSDSTISYLNKKLDAVNRLDQPVRKSTCHRLRGRWSHPQDVLGGQFPDHLIDAERPEIPRDPVAERDGPFFHLLGTDDEHDRNLGKLRVADLGADLLGRKSLSTRNLKVRSVVTICWAYSVCFFGDRQHADLFGGEPERKRPAKCSIRIPMKRSMLPNGARWIITGRCGRLSGPVKPDQTVRGGRNQAEPFRAAISANAVDTTKSTFGP